MQAGGGGNVALTPYASSCASTGSAEIAVNGLTVPDTAAAGAWLVNVTYAVINATGTETGVRVLVSTDGGEASTELQPTANGQYVFGGGITLAPTAITLPPLDCSVTYQFYVG
jgi:hypothetical protein